MESSVVPAVLCAQAEVEVVHVGILHDVPIVVVPNGAIKSRNVVAEKAIEATIALTLLSPFSRQSDITVHSALFISTYLSMPSPGRHNPFLSAMDLDSVERDESDVKRLARSSEALVPMDGGRSVKAVEHHLISEGGALEDGVLLGPVCAVVFTTPTVNDGLVGPH